MNIFCVHNKVIRVIFHLLVGACSLHASGCMFVKGVSTPEVLLKTRHEVLQSYVQQLPQVHKTRGNIKIARQLQGPSTMRAHPERRGLWNFELYYPPSALLQAAGEESIKRRFDLDTGQCPELVLATNMQRVSFDSGNYPGYRKPSVSVVIYAELRDEDGRVLHRGNYSGRGSGKPFVDTGPYHPMLEKQYSVSLMHALMEAYEPALFDMAFRVEERCGAKSYPYALPGLR